MPMAPQRTESQTMRASADPLAEVGVRIGTLVGDTYRIEGVLGTGGMGVVALALDERLERHVAIKFVKPSMFTVPEARDFFVQEARAMARLSHRNVLSVFSFGESEAAPYFVMEFVDGRTVEQWLAALGEGNLPTVDDAVRVMEQACLGVEAIHASGTVHRDLKPSNLLMDKSFRVAVADFGVARVGPSGDGPATLVGTAAYMAPEAAFGEAVIREESRDIYALGCIAYELFTGRAPFVGESDMNILTQHVLQAPVPPSERRPDLPSGFDHVILKALAKDVAERYQSVAAFRSALLAEHRGTRDPERILVADDDPDWRYVLVSALRARFPTSEIDEFDDGASALNAFCDKPYSVALVDLEMPEMDGNKLTVGLRAIDSAHKTPIIVLTAAGGPSEWKRLSAIGADAFLVKPVDAEDVELVIRRTLKARRTGRSGVTVPPRAR
ncbi:MAG: serine/threonine protein kinase [Labilithrix sp.]|nr:serine/threonine protein kinase [Labilithrix sp.]